VPRRHGHNQALAFARDDSVQSFGNAPMVLTDQHLRPDVLAKINEVSRCTLLGLQELETELKAKQFLFGVLRGTRFV
jgi:hypothetical protein